MIVPKIVSYVTPTGRDYSDTTSPDLITEVPGADEIDPTVLVGQLNAAALVALLLGAS